jgi:CheY-like chemotaxis protein
MKAISTAIAFRPDLIVLDVIMPGLDGGDVASLFKAFPALRGVPVIFLTAVVSKERVADPHGRFIGGVLFLAKPIDTKDLIECIDREIVPRAA